MTTRLPMRTSWYSVTRGASQPPSPTATAAPEQKPATRAGRFFRLPVVGASAVPLIAAAAPAIDTPAEEVAQRLAAASEGEPAPALLRLARRLGLSDFERDILLLCVALELDTSIAATLSRSLSRAAEMNRLAVRPPTGAFNAGQLSNPYARAITSCAS